MDSGLEQDYKIRRCTIVTTFTARPLLVSACGFGTLASRGLLLDPISVGAAMGKEAEGVNACA